MLQLAWSYLRARPLGTLLNVLLLALGVGTIGFVLIVNGQIGESLNRDAKGIDLVVGAKGSPIQLMLAGIFHLDVPTGNIPLKSAQELAKNPLIRRVIPLSIADSFRGFWIVGTTPDYIDLYDGTLRVRATSGTTGCRRCWARPSRRTPGLASATASSARTAWPKAGRCMAIPSIRWWAS